MGRVDLFLCGDVMTGRGVDQILAHPSEPEIHESDLRDARQYVDLVELGGDLINAYEGIGGHEEFRHELRLLYFVGFDRAGLAGLRVEARCALAEGDPRPGQRALRDRHRPRGGREPRRLPRSVGTAP